MPLHLLVYQLPPINIIFFILNRLSLFKSYLMIFRKNKLSETHLIQSLQAGDKNAQLAEKQLFNQYAGLVVKGQKQHQLSEDDALDVYSETMLTVFQHIRRNTFKGDSSLKTYIFSIFNKKCIDAIRKKTTTKSRVHYWTEDLETINNRAARQNIQQYLEQTELLQQLETALTQLGQVCKQIILEYAYGYSYNEIATRLNPPFKNAKSVKSKKSQCMKKLQTVIVIT